MPLVDLEPEGVRIECNNNHILQIYKMSNDAIYLCRCGMSKYSHILNISFQIVKMHMAMIIATFISIFVKILLIWPKWKKAALKHVASVVPKVRYTRMCDAYLCLR